MEDKELIQLIQVNPDLGIGKAMELYGRSVNTICQSILKHATDGLVDEAVADTFFKLWKNCSNFQETKDTSMKSYVYSIARNTAIDLWRKDKNKAVSMDEQEWFDLEAEFDLEGDVQEKILQTIIHQVITLLGEPDHTVFLFKYFLGMRNREIANQLKIEDKRVENILYRGKARLKKLLAERGIHSYEER